MADGKTSSNVTVAAVQAAPVFLDRESTVEKACRYIVEAGQHGARLVLLPEAYVPTYPDWVWALPPGEDGLLADLYSRLVANSVDVPGDATDRLGKAAREAGVYLAIGVNERNREGSGTSLYNTLLYFDDQGHLLGKHRKLVSTGAERLVWAQGDGSTLRTHDAPFGRIGGLICWENYMPLSVRHSLVLKLPALTRARPALL